MQTETDGRQPVAYAMLAAVMLFWAGNTIVGRAVAGSVPPFTLAFVRWAGASLVLLPFAWPHLKVDLPAIRRNWPILLTLGVLGIGMFNALLYTSLHYTTATNSLLLQAAIPPMVLLFDALIFRVRPQRAQLLGVLLSCAGVIAVISGGHLETLTHLRFGTGDLLMLAAVTIWGLYTSLLRLRPAMDWRSFLFSTFIVGVVVLLPAAASEWRDFHIATLGPPQWGAFLYVALLPSLLSYALFNAAVERVGPGPAGQASTLLPLFGALLAALLLNEPLGRHHLVGMALILTGILVAALGQRRLRKEPDL